MYFVVHGACTGFGVDEAFHEFMVGQFDMTQAELEKILLLVALPFQGLDFS